MALRKLMAGNKLNFVSLTIIIIAIISILVVILFQALKITKTSYNIESQSAFLYDNEYNPIEVEGTAKIMLKWDGNYYLETEDKSTYNLGKQVVLNNSNLKQVDLYGTVYQVKTDGSVLKLSGNTKVTDFNQDNLFKLADRLYAITSNSIINETGKLNTQKYLIINIDKAGNTYLLNNELNAKTINPMIIQTPTFEFDVANEKLIYNESEIDLKKIIGSTNQYQEVENIEIAAEDEEQENNQNPIENNNINNNNTQINNNNNNQNIQNNNNTNNNIDIDIDNNNNNNNNNDNNANIDVPDDEEKEKVELAKSASIRGITPTSVGLIASYNIQDPESKYQTVSLEIDGDISKTIALNKNETSYTVTGLTPDSDYRVTLVTTQIVNGQSVETIEDIITIKTEPLDINLKVTRITTSKVYFNIKIDKNYVFDSSDVSLYVDGDLKQTIKVDIDAATSENGYTASFDYVYGDLSVIKLENIVYDGEIQNIDVSTKFKN